MLRVAQPDEQNDAEHAFGMEVRDVRRTLGWTQEHLRRRMLEGYGIELSKTAMARLELGQRPIRFNEVYALSALLDIDLGEFAAQDVMSDEEIASATKELAVVQRKLTAVWKSISYLDSAQRKLLEARAMLDRDRGILISKLDRAQGDGREVDTSLYEEAWAEFQATMVELERSDGER